MSQCSDTKRTEGIGLKISILGAVRALLSDDLRGASQSLVAKVIVVPVLALGGLLAARIAVKSLGVDGYAIYALVAGLSALLPFSDLGIGAAVMDAVARRHIIGQEATQSVMVTSWRVLSVAMVSIVSLAWILAGMGRWALLLGTGHSGSVNFAAAIAVSIFGLGLPISIGPRLLVGTGRNHLAIVIQASSAVITLGLLLIASATHAPLWAYTSAPFLALMAANFFALQLGARMANLELRFTIGRAMRPSVRGATVRHMAGPMVIITVVLPLAYQTDRLVLSHVSSLGQVASYSVAFQLFAPLMGLVGSTALALWPVYAVQREGVGVVRQSFVRAQISFGMLGGLLAVALLTIGPYLGRFVGGKSIHVHVGLLGAFAAMLLIQAICYPMAMFLTDASGLRFQAILHVVMLAINLPVSIFLARSIGASGPVLGSVLAIALAMLVPELLRTRKLTAPANPEETTEPVTPGVSS